MKLLREYISLLLVESRISDVQAKYPELDIDELISLDPTNNNKYLDWIAKQANKGHSSEDIAPTVSYFHRNNQRFAKKDINFYEDLKDLENEVKRLSQLKTSKEKKIEAKSGAEIIYRDEEVTVRYIDTKAACQQYGQGTKWCITMKDVTFFEQYTSANIVFYYIFRNKSLGDDFDKVAVSVNRDKDNSIKKIEYWSASDKKYTTVGFENFNKIESIIKQHAVTVPKADLAKLIDGELKGQAVIDVIDLYRDDENAIRQISKRFINIKDPETLTILANDEYSFIRSAAARNTSTPPEVLQILADDKDYDVRFNVTHNPSTLPETLQILANRDAKIHAAQNQSTPSKTLQALANNEDYNVISAVAKNPSTPPSTLQMLADRFDTDDTIISAVARNPSTPSKTLQALASDKNRNIRFAVAFHSSTPSKTLQALAKDKHRDVRKSVALNPSTPVKTLQVLASDKHSNVRFYVARNPLTPSKTLQVLASDKDSSVRTAVARNSLTPPKILNTLASDKDNYVRLSVARNRSSLSKALYILANDEKRDVRKSVALNLSTPQKVLQMLANDKSAVVRQSAQKQLDKRG